MQKVSVIVPVYNSEQYVGYCINSILNQTYRNIEVILVDDGSTDDSLKICRNYENIDKRVKVITTPNKGVSSARNIGIENAIGQYIQFVDSDDVIETQMIERLVETIETYDTDVVFCGAEMITLDKNKKVTDRVKFSSRCMGKECVLRKDVFMEKLPYILLNTVSLEALWNKLYKKSIIDKFNLRFPVEISLGEDLLFNIEYYNMCKGAVFLEDTYYYYLQHNEQALTRKYRHDRFQNQEILLKAFEKLMEDNKAWTPEGKREFSTYIMGQVIRCLKELFREECNMTEQEKKGYIAQILNSNVVRDNIQKAIWIDENFRWIKDAIEFSDVEKVYSRCKIICSKKYCQEQLEKVTQTIEDNNIIRPEDRAPGIINKVLVKVVAGLVRITKSERLWRVRENLINCGIKRTVKKSWSNK
ncbi:glycosyltransferase family 2 protein [Clostridium sp. CMCC3677]|uniref:glycosyltransferase family 2 protein n=1 Tax=Clostridium sp. CMCC3677 TaxID=2949963 RepID=UPI0013F04D36|nr:glycosyltransferase family 2 protein [Clostridium sp. CMCC3677]NFG60723.1 glycosyltransferase family 2 protein [Clostridium botulinum]NFQ08157.1 glycosyltransferase family 2 protein [Clostridium botulinum]